MMNDPRFDKISAEAGRLSSRLEKLEALVRGSGVITSHGKSFDIDRSCRVSDFYKKTDVDAKVKEQADLITLLSLGVPATWYLVSRYATINAAVGAVGTKAGTLVIDADCTATTDLTVPANVAIFWLTNTSVTHATHSLTINAKFVNDPTWQIFDGSGTVSFAEDSIPLRRPEWWGWSTSATGVENSAAHAKMMASISDSNATYKAIEYMQGTYKIAGDPAIALSKPMLKVNFSGAIFDYESGTGNAVLIGRTTTGSLIANCTFRGPLLVKRTFTLGGVMSEKLIGIGVKYCNISNFACERIRADGFAYGHKFTSAGAGTAYGWLYDLETNECLNSIYITDENVVGSYTEGLTFHGGRLATGAGASYDNISGSSLIKLKKGLRQPGGHNFFGLLPENAAERKIFCDGVGCSFRNLYLDAGSYDTDFGNYVGYPYAAQLTNVTTVAGSAVITKTTHGIYALAGDVVRITSGSDTGFYYVNSFDANTITLDRALTANSSTVSLDYFRANIEFTSESSNCTITECNNLCFNAVSDKGAHNILIDSRRGLAVGTADPSYGTSEPGNGYGILDLRREYNGTVDAHLTNLTANTLYGSLALNFRGKDTNGTIRSYAKIIASPEEAASGYIKGGMLLSTDSGGNFEHHIAIKSDGKIGHGTTTPKNRTDIAGGLAVGATIAGKETAPTNGVISQGPIYIGEKYKIVEAGDAEGQLSGWRLYGVTDNPTTLYYDLTWSGANPTVTVYDNSAGGEGDIVCSGTREGDGAITLTEENGSGISGSVSATGKLTEAGDSANQMSAWAVYGLTTAPVTLYWKVIFSGADPTVTVYNNSDGAAGNAVCSGTRTGDGIVTLTALNDSGISAFVTVTASGPTNDTDLVNNTIVYGPSDDDDTASNTLTLSTVSETTGLLLRDSRYQGSTGIVIDNPVTDGTTSIAFRNDTQAWNIYGADGLYGDSLRIYDATNAKDKIKITPDTGDTTISNGNVVVEDNLSVDGSIITNNGVIAIKETMTPTAVSTYGRIYTKSDNLLYFQDGDGTEHRIAYFTDIP